MGLTLSPKFALVALWYNRMTCMQLSALVFSTWSSWDCALDTEQSIRRGGFCFSLYHVFLICSCCYVAPFTFSKWIQFWRTQGLYALLREKCCKYRQRKLLVECCIEWGDYIRSFYYRLLLIQFLPLWCRSIMGFHLSESYASGLDYSIFLFF